MPISVRVISTPKDLLRIESDWNRLVKKSCKNPLCLSDFIKEFMDFNRSRGWTPQVLIIATNERIVGISPLTMKKLLGIRFVKFLSGFRASTGFIMDDQYEDTCIEYTIKFLFEILQCRFAEFVLPAECPTLPILKQKCKANSIGIMVQPAMRCNIIPIRSTWAEFQVGRGRNFRKKFRKIERNLDRAGSWRIIQNEKRDKKSDTIKKILDIERASWKQMWRFQTGEKEDDDLMIIWKGIRQMARTETDFEWNVWFLELDGQKLAYTLVLQYKETAFIMKTSYNMKYKRLYPGIYIVNATIRTLFNNSHVRNIDFTTDLPFHKTWTHTSKPQVRVIMAQKGVSSLALSIITKLENVLHLKISDMIFLPLTKEEIVRTFWHGLREARARADVSV